MNSLTKYTQTYTPEAVRPNAGRIREALGVILMTVVVLTSIAAFFDVLTK